MITSNALRVAACLVAVSLSAGGATAATVTETFDSGTSVDGLDGINGFAGGMLYNDGFGASIYNAAGLGVHDTVTISFSLALVDSWDGSTGGHPNDDWFNVVLDGTEVFQISADNYHLYSGGASNPESIPASATNRTNGSFYRNYFTDSVWLVSFSVAHSAATAELRFFADGSGYQGGSDESWAIDNLKIVSNEVPVEPGAVPLPAALPLLLAGLGAMGLAGRRRRV